MKFNIKHFIIHIIVYIFLFQDTIFFYFNNSLVNNLDEIFILLYGAVAFFYCIRKGQINKTSFIIIIFSMIYLFVGFLSGIMNSNFHLSHLIFGGFLTVKIYVLIFSLINVPLKRSILSSVINALKIAALACALIGIFNFIFPALYLKIFAFGFIDTRMGLPSIMSLFIHPGQFGWFMLFIAIYYFSEYTRKKEKKLIYLFLFYSIIALLSFKVKVIIGILVVLLVYVYIIENRKVKATNILTLIGLVSAIWMVFGKLISNTYKLYFTQADTISARYALTNTSIEIAKDYFPLGVGFGKFASWFARVDYSEFYYKYGISNVYGLNPENPGFATDTFWPMIIGETGFIGCGIYITLLIYILYKLYKLYKENYVSHLNIFAILILVQGIVESTGEPIFNSSPQNIIIGVILGSVLSKGKGYNEKSSILYA